MLKFSRFAYAYEPDSLRPQKETGLERALSTVLPRTFRLCSLVSPYVSSVLVRFSVRSVCARSFLRTFLLATSSSWIAPGLSRRGALAVEVPPIASLAALEATTTSIGRPPSITRMVRMN